MAVNPTDPNNVIAGYESPFSSNGVSAYSWSTDAGRTWSGGGFVGPWNGDMMPQGNSRVAFDASGVGYYSTQASGSTTTGYFILTSTNGIAWGTPVPIAISDYSEARHQSFLAIDTAAVSPYSGSIYMFWLFTNNTSPYYQGIRMRYSRNHGLTWSQDIQVSDPANVYSFGPSAVVASNGTIYVAFQELDGNTINNPPKLFLDRSTDGGLTWATDQMITGQPITPAGRADYKGRELTFVSNSSCNLIHANHFPSLAISPSDPATLYVVWNDGRWESPTSWCGIPGRNSDIAFSRTTDGGQTWGTVQRLNDDPADNGIDHFQPSISVRNDGLIGVSWLDRRYDAGGYFYDVAYTQAADGGLTWTANQRVSDISNDPDALPDYKGLDDLGQRNSLVFSGLSYVLPSWIHTTGTRQGDFDTDRGAFPTATPTPTAQLVGHITWQGRPAQPNTLQQLPVTLTLKLGTTEINYPAQTTDASGVFTVPVSGLVGGTYTWRAKGPRFLANSGTVTLSGLRAGAAHASTSLEVGFMLGADTNNDNIINVVDFNILKGTFGKTLGDPGYDERADFNGDNRINISDFNQLKGNFGTGGAPPI